MIHNRKKNTNDRFRKSTLHRPGRKVLHPGFADDPSVDHLVHGARTVPSEPVGDVLASQYPTNPVLRFQRERAEAAYASTTREPLGRSGSQSFSPCRRSHARCSARPERPSRPGGDAGDHGGDAGG